MEKEVLAELQNLQPISLQSIGNEAELRMEWRINANTGGLVGVVFRERNKGRKAVRYVGKRSKGERKAEFERYANGFTGAKRGGANGSSIGNALHGGEDIGKAVIGNRPNWTQPENAPTSYVH